MRLRIAVLLFLSSVVFIGPVVGQSIDVFPDVPELKQFKINETRICSSIKSARAQPNFVSYRFDFPVFLAKGFLSSVARKYKLDVVGGFIDEGNGFYSVVYQSSDKQSFVEVYLDEAARYTTESCISTY